VSPIHLIEFNKTSKDNEIKKSRKEIKEKSKQKKETSNTASNNDDRLFRFRFAFCHFDLYTIAIISCSKVQFNQSS